MLILIIMLLLHIKMVLVWMLVLPMFGYSYRWGLKQTATSSAMRLGLMKTCWFCLAMAGGWFSYYLHNSSGSGLR